MKKLTKIFAMIAAASLLMLTLSGCSSSEQNNLAAAEEPVLAENPAVPVETEAQSEAGSTAGMKDGERFEGVIMIEGMEETVRYESPASVHLGMG